MSKKIDPGIEEYRKNLPSALGLKGIKADMDAAYAQYDKVVASRENQNAFHNALAAAARRKAGIAPVGANAGLTDTGRNRVGKQQLPD